MANDQSDQARLDKVTMLVANNMQAEVSSIYLVLGSGELELFATEGLKKSAVHTTKMPAGKGLVSYIAKSATHLNLPNARSHPNFLYLPETGEDLYHSFLGVPILKHGISIGVLTVQNKSMRIYSEEECEVLYTVSMLLAEVITTSKSIRLSGLVGGKDNDTPEIVDASHSMPVNLSGISFSNGIAIGHVVLHEPRIIIANLIADDVEAEHKRLSLAVRELRKSISNMLEHLDLSRTGEHRDILETYLMFANDRGWKRKMHEALTEGITAEIAVEKVQIATRARMLRQPDPYLRERLHDLDDLGNRLLRILTNNQATSVNTELPEDTILVARNLGPAELLDYDKNKLKGLILEEGAANSHAGIVARAMGIPAVGSVTDIFNYIEQDDPVIVDGEAAEVYLRPAKDVSETFIDKIALFAEKQQEYAKIRELPAMSKDQQNINLMINAGLDADLEHFNASGATGIGLYRTEVQLMLLSKYPGKDALQANYKKVFDHLGDKSVTFRTFDVGGDKVLPYIRRTKEENPALGWRAIRMALDRPGLFKHQLRALLLAARGQELNIMFPMIADISEFRAAKQHVMDEKAILEAKNIGVPKKVNLGLMIEVPALLWQLPALFKEADFASVGSNDLLQFTYAADRDNPLLHGRYHSLTTPVLTMLRTIVVAANEAGIPLSLCGEIAGKPKLAAALLGIGFKNLSMNSATVGPVKMMIRSLDIEKFAAFLNKHLDEASEGINDLISDYISENNVKIGI
ncbi:MAG: phosphoenolpyruvate--protein phosphotransferase [Rhizobiales bacterium]|nr:phosphoenolpyruvate--protein phosphotransferase [Hyphomicrobiales bacterium]